MPGQQSEVYPNAPTGLRVPDRRGHSARRCRRRATATSRRAWASPIHRASPTASCIRCSAKDKSSIRVGLRDLLHGIPGAFGGHHVRRAAVRLQLPEPGAAAVRDAVHHCGRRDRQRAALPAHRRRRSTPRRTNPCNLDFSPLHSGQRATRSSITTTRCRTRDDYMLSIQRELAGQRGRSAPATSATGGVNILVAQQANPGDPALCLSVSEPSQVAPGQRRRAGRSPRTASSRGADGTVINGTRSFGPEFRQRHGAEDDRRVALQRDASRRALLAQRRRIPGRLHAGEVDGHRRRTSASRSIRSTSTSVRAVVLGHAPQLRRELHRAAAVRSAVRRATR